MPLLRLLGVLAAQRFGLALALAVVWFAAAGAQTTCDGYSACLADLQSADPAKKSAAIFMLGKMKKPEAVGPLMDLARDESDGRARLSALKAVGAIGHAGAIEPLRAMFKDRDPAVRQEAVRAVTRIGGKPAVAALIGGLNQDEIQVSVIQGLGEIADPESKPQLVGIYQKTKDERVRGVAAMAIHRVNSIWGPDEKDMGLPLYPGADFIPNERAEWVFLTKDSVVDVASFYEKALRRPPMSFNVFRNKYEGVFPETKEGKPAAVPEKIFVAEEQSFAGKKYPSKMVFIQTNRSETEIRILAAAE